MALEASHIERDATVLTLSLQPVAFDGLFGWFSPGIGRRGVVLCGTHGYEQLSAHRSWQRLAGRIAATGCATLSVDYPGTGDSADEGADSVQAWVGAIRRAIRYLREEAQAEEIVLVGLRLGATLAALAAQGEDIDRLVLLAPFASGRTYLREMKMQSRTIGRLPDGSPLPQEAGCLTVGGFHIGPALAAELSAIDIAAIERVPAPDILLIGTEVGGLGPRYAALGARVTVQAFPGLATLVANPLYAETPDETFSAVAAYVADGAHPRPVPSLVAPQPQRSADPICGAAWSEEPVRFGSSLFGILCRPREANPHRPTVLFVNGGTNVHSGWGRQTTNLARWLAQEGFASLRMDLRGIGDSPDRPDAASPLYSLAPLDDVAAALDHLETVRLGPVAIVGSCSGAYLAFHALCREHRLKGALLINPYCFDWNPQDDVDTVIRTVIRNASTYAGLLRRGDVWRRLLCGDIRVGTIARILAKAGRARVAKHLVRLFHPRPADGSVGQRVAELRRRGAQLHLVYCNGDRGLAALHEHLGRSPARVARRLGQPVTMVGGVDHDLSTLEAQRRLAEALKGLLARLR